MSTTQNTEMKKQFTRRFTSLEGKFESPSSKNRTEVSKISENIKLLSSEINTQYTKRASMKNNENIHEIISNLFDKDAQMVALTNKQSVIHELDFLKKSPQAGQRKKSSVKMGLRRRSTMTSSQKSRGIQFNQRSFSLSNTDKFQAMPLRKISTLNSSVNNNYNISKKKSFKKVEFSIFDKSPSKAININQSLIDFESDSESIGEIEREFLLFGFSNTKRIKKNRIKSMENNPKKLGFYEKNLFHKQKKLLEIEMLRNKIKSEKQHEFKEFPELSKKTKDIIKEKLNYSKPLYRRIDEVIEDKNNYILKLKKFHKEEDKNLKWKEFNANYDNNAISDINNELSNIDNFEYSHYMRNPQHNSNTVKNHKTNFNNKFLNSKKAAESSSGNQTFIKMLNETTNNVDLHNLTSIPPLGTQKNEYTDDQYENEKAAGFNNSANSKFSNQQYFEFMRNRKKISSDKQNINNNRSSADNRDIYNKRNKNHIDFLPDKYVKFDIAYPERTLNWVKRNDHMFETRKKKMIDQKVKSEKAADELLINLFKPKTNKNSDKIVNAKKLSSRSMNMSQNEFNNYYHNNINNNFNNENNENINDFSNYNNNDNFNNDKNNEYEDDMIFNNDYNNNYNQSMYKSRLNSQDQTVFESLYSRRFEAEEKRKKILKEITSDFTPKLNSYYRPALNASSSTNTYFGESLIKSATKINNIPDGKVINISIKTEERKERILEKRRQREENWIRKRQGNAEGSNVKRTQKNLMDMLDDVEKENLKIQQDEISGKRRKSETSNLYKLNIRSASAWDHNKENSIFFDRKFEKILAKLG